MGRRSALLTKGILVAWIVSLALGTRYVFGQPQDFGANQHLEYTRLFLPLSALVSVALIVALRRYAPRLSLRSFFALLALVVAVAIGANRALRPDLAVWWFALLCTYGLTTVLVYRYCQRDAAARQLLGQTVFAVAAVEASLGLLQFALGHSLGLWRLGEPVANDTTLGVAKLAIGTVKLLRPFGTFPHANLFGAFCVVGLCAYALANKNKDRSSTLEKVGAGLVTLGLIVSFSRSAWLSGLVALLAIFVLGGRSRWRVTGTTIVVALLGIVAFVPLLTGRFNLSEQTQQLDIRNSLSSAAAEVLQQNPLVGVGLRNFVPVLQARHPDWQPFELQPVHNVGLLLAAEVGLLGVAAILALCIPLLRSPRIGDLATFLVLLPLATLDHYLISIPQGVGIAVLLILLLTNLSVPRETKKFLTKH
ncbi:MAG: O-antigen ligase family protein [Candidatus Andersenbacteria bacterium]